MTDTLIAERRGNVHHVRLNSPENRNAMSIAMLDGLVDVARGAADDDSCRGLVIDHVGDVFCAGVDIAERRRLPAGARNHSEALADAYSALWKVPQPVLVRVGGAVRGGGMGLLVCADMVVATSAASFAFSEVRIGVPPALVGALAMAKVGGARLAPWLLTGAVFDATEALATGLVHRVAATDGRDEIAGWSDAIGKAGPRSVAITKRLAQRFVRGDIDELIAEMRVVSAAAFDSDEAREGMAAFADKRPAVWLT